MEIRFINGKARKAGQMSQAAGALIGGAALAGGILHGATAGTIAGAMTHSVGKGLATGAATGGAVLLGLGSIAAAFIGLGAALKKIDTIGKPGDVWLFHDGGGTYHEEHIGTLTKDNRAEIKAKAKEAKDKAKKSGAKHIRVKVCFYPERLKGLKINMKNKFKKYKNSRQYNSIFDKIYGGSNLDLYSNFYKNVDKSVDGIYECVNTLTASDIKSLIPNNGIYRVPFIYLTGHDKNNDWIPYSGNPKYKESVYVGLYQPHVGIGTDNSHFSKVSRIDFIDFDSDLSMFVNNNVNSHGFLDVDAFLRYFN